MRKKKDPKTVRGWLMRLPEPLNTFAINNAKNYPYAWNLKTACSSMYQAISNTFVWKDTPEGYRYWQYAAFGLGIPKLEGPSSYDNVIIPPRHIASNNIYNTEKPKESLDETQQTLDKLEAGQRLLLDNYIELNKKIDALALAYEGGKKQTSKIKGLLLVGEQPEPAGTIRVILNLQDGTELEVINTCANSIYHWINLSDEHIDQMKKYQK